MTTNVPVSNQPIDLDQILTTDDMILKYDRFKLEMNEIKTYRSLRRIIEKRRIYGKNVILKRKEKKLIDNIKRGKILIDQIKLIRYMYEVKNNI